MKELLKNLLFLSGLLLCSLTTAQDYQVLKNPMPQRAGPGQVVVQQFLWHKCIHCYRLEADVQTWLDHDKPEFLVFERIPVAWSDDHLADGAFYTAAVALYRQGALGQNELGRINDSLFDLHFAKQLSLNPENALPFFQPHGIEDTGQLLALIDSPAARNERARAKRLTMGYQIANVPVFVVAGKYLVSLGTLGPEATPEKLFATINRLAAQERPRPLITPFIIPK